MRLVACLAWFDESPTMIAACIASLRKLPVDHLVAVDGGYRLFPDARAVSDVDQTNAVTWTCQSVGIGLTLHQPSHPWRGNEVEKRSALFRLATSMLTPDDWLLVIDADEVVEHADPSIGDCLIASALDLGGGPAFDVATVTLKVHVDPLESEQAAFTARCSAVGHTLSPARRFFRALPDLRVELAHYCYLAGHPARVLWSAGLYPEEPALDLQGLVVLEHRNKLRTRLRNDRAKAFYEARETSQIEHPPTEKELAK